MTIREMINELERLQKYYGGDVTINIDDGECVFEVTEIEVKEIENENCVVIGQRGEKNLPFMQKTYGS